MRMVNILSDFTLVVRVLTKKGQRLLEWGTPGKHWGQNRTNKKGLFGEVVQSSFCLVYFSTGSLQLAN